MDIPAKRDPNRCPTHPGDLIEEAISANRMTKAHAAERLGISRQTLHAILTEKQPVTANIAARLGKLFGNGPGLWLRMQAAYDTWHAAHGQRSAPSPDRAT